MVKKGLFGLPLDKMPTPPDPNEEAGRSHGSSLTSEEGKLAPCLNSDGTKKPFPRILRTPLPPMDDPAFRSELERRWNSLFEYLGVPLGDVEAAFPILVMRCVPGLRIAPCRPEIDTSHRYFALIEALKAQRPRGRPPIPPDMVNEAADYIKKRKARNKSVGVEKICDDFLHKKARSGDRLECQPKSLANAVRRSRTGL